MDSMGLDSQGLLIPGAETAEKGAQALVNGAHTGVQAIRPLSGTNRVKAAVADVNQLTQPKPLTSEDHRINGLRKVEGLNNNLFMADAITQFGIAGGLATLATRMKMPRVGVIIRAVLSSPIETLRHTPLNELHKLPANYMRSVSKYAEQAGGKGGSKWASSAAEKSAKLSASADRVVKTIKDKPIVARTSKDVTAKIERGLNKAERTSLGKAIEKRLQKLAKWRTKSANKKYVKSITSAQESLVSGPQGFVAKAKGFFSFGKKEVAEVMAPEFASVESSLRSAGQVTGEAAIAHLTSAQTALELLESGADKARLGHIQSIHEGIDASLRAAGKSHFLEEAKSLDLTGLAKSLVKGTGRFKALTGLVAVGVTAGIGATLLNSKKESREAKEAFKQVAEDIGDDTHPLMENIKKAYGKQKHGHAANTGLLLVGNVANGAMMAAPGGGGMGVFAAAMLPQMVGQLLVSDNPLLNAYANLKHDEQGVKLKHEDKVACVKAIIGGAVPSVVNNGGIYNKLVGPVTEAIVAQNLSVHDMMKLLADDTKFSALATKVLEEQKAAPKAGEAPVAKAAVEVANDNHAHTAKAPASKAEAAYHAADKPVSLIAGDRAHEGTVATHQRVASV